MCRACSSSSPASSSPSAVASGTQSPSPADVTCTAAGVNLPARRVIFPSPRIAHLALDATHYRQAANGAGGTGLVSGGGNQQKSFG
mmetsp:Transcript_42745/g.132012  ORF Transcript_42745/g.132012 Transcript_42745/m.132012 type:complete len:86 (-) Transcript_42745:369-626(-)